MTPLRLVIAGACFTFPEIEKLLSMVQFRSAGVWSMFPAWSTARTLKVCGPWPNELYVAGEVHEAYEPPSIRHWNVAPPSFELNWKVADVDETVPLGPVKIVVSGAVVSMVQVLRAGDPS